MNKQQDQFRFRSKDFIGVADAAEDGQFLQDCFVDTGALETLRDRDDPRYLILGRPGTGKTALLIQLKQLKAAENRVIEISPEDLALSHITNSTILKYVTEDLGVSLAPFFKVLWQHVFTVELLRRQFKITDPNAQKQFFAEVSNLFRSAEEKEAIRYVEDSGKPFWNETEERVTEETKTLEDKLKAAVDGKIPHFSGKAEASRSMTEKEKQEIIYHASQIINDIHIKKLPQVTDYILKKLRDKQKFYHIIIDRLDDDWVDDRYRYQLIRALIEAARRFNQENRSQVKVVVALRRDLIERVFAATQDPGFQAEKIQALYLNLQWTKPKLEEMLDTRINRLVRGRHPAQKVTYRDILPRQIDNGSTIDYILKRTLMRPRDVIDFFNRCILLADGKPKITEAMIRQAEAGYSQSRIQALLDEWRADHPTLRFFVNVLKQRPASFSASDITDAQCEELCLQVATLPDIQTRPVKNYDAVTLAAMEIANGGLHADVERFRRLLLAVLYKVSIIGLKLESYQETSWSYKDQDTVEESAILPKTHVYVHACAFRDLGIVPSK